MSQSTPSSWKDAKIGSLCDLINGRAFKPKEWSSSGIPIIRIQNLNNPKAKYNYYDGELSDKHRIESGDLLFAWSGTPGTSFGAHVWEGPTAALNQHIFKIVFDDSLIDKRFLRYAINQTLDELISGAHGGVGLRHVTKGKFESTKVAFPAFAEQKVIADKLDVLLARVEATKDRLESIPKILKRFRQSVLGSAVGGTLTKDFEPVELSYYEAISTDISSDPKLKKIPELSDEEIASARDLFDKPDWEQWKLYALEQLVESERGIPYGIVQTGQAQKSGVPTIRCGDVKPLSVDVDNLKNVHPEIEEKYARTRLKGGEVILAIRGTVGNAAVITDDLARLSPNISREVAMIPVRSNIDSRFIALLLQSPGGYRSLAEKTKGVAQRGINLSDVRRLVTPLPTLKEQREIVSKVIQLFSRIESIERKARSALTLVNNLSQSILAKALRGELTEQWRNCNPGLIGGKNSPGEQLERIRLKRSKVGDPLPRRRKG